MHMRAPQAFLWVKAHGAHHGGGRPERGKRRGRQASPAADAAAARADAEAEASAGGATLHALPAARFCTPSLGTHAFHGPLTRSVWCPRTRVCLPTPEALAAGQGPKRPGDTNARLAPKMGPHVMRTWGAAEGHPLSPGSSLRTCYTDDSAPASPAAPVLEAADDACWWQDNQARPEPRAAWRALRVHCIKCCHLLAGATLRKCNGCLAHGVDSMHCAVCVPSAQPIQVGERLLHRALPFGGKCTHGPGAAQLYRCTPEARGCVGRRGGPLEHAAAPAAAAVAPRGASAAGLAADAVVMRAATVPLPSSPAVARVGAPGAACTESGAAVHVAASLPVSPAGVQAGALCEAGSASGATAAGALRGPACRAPVHAHHAASAQPDDLCCAAVPSAAAGTRAEPRAAVPLASSPAAQPGARPDTPREGDPSIDAPGGGASAPHRLPPISALPAPHKLSASEGGAELLGGSCAPPPPAKAHAKPVLAPAAACGGSPSTRWATSADPAGAGPVPPGQPAAGAGGASPPRSAEQRMPGRVHRAAERWEGRSAAGSEQPAGSVALALVWEAA